tara:strand:+ start:824 stop:1312 length:489 start_codon:yes stop_codon:yes gene_type:complete
MKSFFLKLWIKIFPRNKKNTLRVLRQKQYSEIIKGDYCEESPVNKRFFSFGTGNQMFIDPFWTYIRINDKVEVAKKVIQKLKIDFSEVAFVGDDINDYKSLKVVGYSAVPLAAPDYIKKIVTFSFKTKGDDGVFREFIDKILIEMNIDVHASIEKYYSNQWI